MKTYRLPLLDRFPSLSQIPRTPFLSGPTPLELMTDLGAKIGCENFWIKRDDLTSEKYGGNKTRKLEFGIADALSKGYDAVVTTGGYGTNHGLATAIFAKESGLSAHLVLFKQPVTDHVRENLRLYQYFGAKIHPAPGYAQTGFKVAALLAASRLGLLKERIGFIGPGGSSALTNLGFVNAVYELANQLSSSNEPPPSHIFCPVGSCGTFTGLLVGLKLSGLPCKLIGVRVVEKIFANPRNISALANQTLSLMKSHGARIDIPAIRPKDVYLLNDFYGDCYGCETIEGKQAMDVAGASGLYLEPTYTAKAFAGMMDFIKILSPKSKILYWYTLNSRDFSKEADSVKIEDLHKKFQPLFKD